MFWQYLFLALFALNLLLMWLLRKLVWYRVFGLAFLGLIPCVTVFFKQPLFVLDYYWWRVAGGVMIVLGMIIAGWAKLEFRKAGLMPFDRPKTLVTSGPYKLVRHPQYLGLVFFLVGWWWVWAAVYSFYFGMIMLALIWINAWLEERLVLEKQFGNAYRHYRQHAGMFWVK